MIANGELEDVVDSVYFLNNVTKFIENDELQDFINENDFISSILTDHSIAVMEVKKSSD